MATYNLTGPEREIITSWLFEEGGYLDAAINVFEESARQALLANPSLNVLTWIRTNQIGIFTDADNWSQCGMIWWIRINDGVNVNNPQRPPERVQWRAYLELWNTQLVQNPGDTTPIPMTAENGASSTMPANAHRVQQRNLIAKVLNVM
jgi:hypothetical protein